MTFDIKYNSVNKDLIEMLTLIVLDCVYIYLYTFIVCYWNNANKRLN